MAAPSLQNLIIPQSQQQVVSLFLQTLQGLGQVMQAGAMNTPPVGGGVFALSGIPVDNYDVLVLVLTGGNTADLQLQYSLDDGSTWSTTQSSSGASPWVVPVLDYRSGGTQTGMTITFSNGLEATSSWVVGESYSFPATLPQYPLSDFESGAVGRTILEVNAQTISNWTGAISNVAAGGFTLLAMGAWLTLLAQQIYNLQRKLALPTLGLIQCTDAGGQGPWTLTPGATIFVSESGNQYTPLVQATLPQSKSVCVPVTSVNAGAIYNDEVGTITTLSTSLPGVTLSNNFGLQLGAVPWQASTAYDVGYLVRPQTPNGFIYFATSGSGTSGSTAPRWTTTLGASFSDGTVTWICWSPDGTLNSYLQGQVNASPALGEVYILRQQSIVEETVAADIVLQVVTQGYVGQATVAVSTDSGSTYGEPAVLPQYVFGNPNTQVGTWQASHGYSAGSGALNHVYPLTKNGFYFQCTGSGTSGSTEPAWDLTVGSNTTDNGVTWTNVGAGVSYLPISGGGSGPNLGGQPVIVFIDDEDSEPSFQAGDNYLFTTDWASQYGNDTEADSLLALRCQQQWATLAFGFPMDEIAAWAKAASPEVQIVSATPDITGNGSIDLCVGGSNGQSVSINGLVAVTNYVVQRLMGCITLAGGTATTTQTATLQLQGTVYVTKQYLASAQTALAAALAAYELLVGIGSTLLSRVAWSSVVGAFVQNQFGVRNVDSFELINTTMGGAGGTFTDDDFTLAPGYIVSFDQSGLTFVGI
jgi:hypothetical protein